MMQYDMMYCYSMGSFKMGKMDMSENQKARLCYLNKEYNKRNSVIREYR